MANFLKLFICQYIIGKKKYKRQMQGKVPKILIAHHSTASKI